MANIHNQPEIWADIPNFEWLYFATESGRIWAHDKTWISGMNGHIFKHKAMHKLKPSTDKYTYLRVSLCKEGKTYCRRVNIWS